jgi:hypothetical protein
MEATVEIKREREYQKTQFTEFDKTNSKNDWVSYITAYAGRAADKVKRNETEGQKFRDNMVKVGALAQAAVEAYDAGFCK